MVNLGWFLDAPAQVRAPDTASGDDLHAVGKSLSVPLPPDTEKPDVRLVFARANAERVAEGVAQLAWSPQLAAAAGAHAQLMAHKADTELSHRYPGEPDLTTRASSAGAHFSSIAENIAQGASARQIAQVWMQSVPHRTNILDPRMNTLGVAVFASGGTLYAVEDFAATVPVLTLDAVEQRVAAELLALGVPMSGDATGGVPSVQLRDQTRSNCPLANGMLEGSMPGMIVRWQGAELNLPQPLVDLVHSRHFAAAAVGACAPVSSATPGFTTYRVAVLLF